jgi:hypothetical protein
VRVVSGIPGYVLRVTGYFRQAHKFRFTHYSLLVIA